jgi:hypothetical protein
MPRRALENMAFLVIETHLKLQAKGDIAGNIGETGLLDGITGRSGASALRWGGHPPE